MTFTNATLKFSRNTGYGKLHRKTIHFLIRYIVHNYDKIISLYIQVVELFICIYSHMQLYKQQSKLSVK
jgi:hypothetical protein